VFLLSLRKGLQPESAFNPPGINVLHMFNYPSLSFIPTLSFLFPLSSPLTSLSFLSYSCLFLWWRWPRHRKSKKIFHVSVLVYSLSITLSKCTTPVVFYIVYPTVTSVIISQKLRIVAPQPPCVFLSSCCTISSSLWVVTTFLSVLSLLSPLYFLYFPFCARFSVPYSILPHRE
jgi:hypothetical protein